MKQNPIYTATLCGETSRVEVLSHINKAGRANVKILQQGLLTDSVGFVVYNFELVHGVLKFEEEE
jgi:hypothetical protein